MDMTQAPEVTKIIYSLVVPHDTDVNIFQSHIDKICSIMDDQTPNCYEIIAIEGKGQDVPDNDWDHVKGEILVIIDGDMNHEPTTLRDVVDAFSKGSDMAFAGQYDGTINDKNIPILSYFGIRRSSLPRIHESPEGYKLILDILGPDTIKKLSTEPTKISDKYILQHLRKMIGLGT